jgi:hypothetical protein
VKSIVLAGALAQKPGRGGHTWVFLQYLLGFRRLGWDVLFLDSHDEGQCVDETGAPVPVDRSWNARYTEDVMHACGLGESYAILHDAGRRTLGLTRADVLRRVRESSALINVMGFLRDEEILAAAPQRVFLDIDPGFPQMWRELGLHDAFAGHDQHVTIGGHIGAARCQVPTCGLRWITTRPPVVLDCWPSADASTTADPITTVASWRGAYGPVEYGGRRFGLRVHEFRRFASLPSLTGRPFTVALDIHAAESPDHSLLDRHGWRRVDPLEVAGDPWRYRNFIRRSSAELMVAKGMYVESQSGWVSDRSLCYLASGKPVIAQDTGLDGVMPVGEGVLPFSTLDEAAEQVRAMTADYPRHARAARAIAEELFDSSKVLRTLSERLSLS